MWLHSLTRYPGSDFRHERRCLQAGLILSLKSKVKTACDIMLPQVFENHTPSDGMKEQVVDIVPEGSLLFYRCSGGA
jgi:hypothetical protein